MLRSLWPQTRFAKEALKVSPARPKARPLEIKLSPRASGSPRPRTAARWDRPPGPLPAASPREQRPATYCSIPCGQASRSAGLRATVTQSALRPSASPGPRQRTGPARPRAAPQVGDIGFRGVGVGPARAAEAGVPGPLLALRPLSCSPTSGRWSRSCSAFGPFGCCDRSVRRETWSGMNVDSTPFRKIKAEVPRLLRAAWAAEAPGGLPGGQQRQQQRRSLGAMCRSGLCQEKAPQPGRGLRAGSAVEAHPSASASASDPALTDGHHGHRPQGLHRGPALPADIFNKFLKISFCLLDF